MKLFFRKLDVPGKGIPRNAATAKKGFARLWEIFTVEYKSLCILSLVFSLFCIPVVTIRPPWRPWRGFRFTWWTTSPASSGTIF